MSQRDHELMESVAADAQAITAPASPLRRDSMEDADDSLTRKRPRLDNGSPNNFTMTAEPTSTSANSIQQREQRVEMTIRSQPPSSTNLAGSPDGAAHLMASNSDEDVPVLVSTEDPLAGEEDDAPADSPPVVAVEDDAEAMSDYVGSGSGYVDVEIEYDEEDYFRQFPFTHAHHGSYVNALRTVVAHIQGGNPIDGTVLPQITVWLESMPNRPSQRRGYYLDKAGFWDEFAGLANKVLIRRFPFGETFRVDGQTEYEIISAFLRSYLKLCGHFLQIDATLLSKATDESPYDFPVLSSKHLRQLHTILRPEKSPVFNLLGKEYAAPTNEMGLQLLQAFVEPPTNGMQHLLQFAGAACNKLAANVRNNLAIYVTQIIHSVGWIVFSTPDPDVTIDRPQFCSDILHHFQTYNADLQEPSKVVDVGVTKDLLLHFSVLLYDICSWDQQYALQLAEDLLDFRDPDSPTTSEDGETKARSESFRSESSHFPALVSNAWKFKLLRKYVVKGRMELRVMSIGTMDNALVEIWREYNISDAGTNHPVMQYLADFLLHERVIDYIISVDSHPQLISRSGNIVGFLVVTHRYSERQTDAIWNTVSNSPDPRVVTATMAMLRGIVSLMDVPELLYICTKLYDLSIDSLTLDVLRFLREVVPKISNRFWDWGTTLHKARPWNVCIRIMQDTPPNRNSTKLTTSLHNEACEQLRMLSQFPPADERRQIYRDCAAHITNGSEQATGSVRAICILCATGYNDFNFFKENLDITRQIIEELCSFVKGERQLESHSNQTLALQYRLELLHALVHRVPESIPKDLYQEIWNHLVGKWALNNYVRDLAWSKLSEIIRYKPDNQFCKELVSNYIPQLEPEYFTTGLYEFVASVTFPTIRRCVTTKEGDKTLLQIPGADILWPMILTAPRGTIEDRSARLLASRYIEIAAKPSVSLAEVEEAHIALVERCTEEILSSYKIIRGGPNREKSAVTTSDGMDIVLSEDALQQTELRFGRTLLFEKLLLTLIRTKPEFNRSRRADSKVEALEPEAPSSEPVEIRYSAGSEKQSVWIGKENTLNDLYTRLCYATGYTKINLFSSGQRLNVGENGYKKIAELQLGRGGLILVQKAPGSEATMPLADGSASCSVFEATILKHFEELFACMDSDDYISETLFEFLSCFPFSGRISDAVMMGSASADGIFPPGRVFQAKYAAHALQSKLREQLRRGSHDENLLANSIQLLDKALLNETLISQTLMGRHEIELAAVLVGVLLEFLKERPSQDISSRYFSDESALVDRLLMMLSIALETDKDLPSIAYHSYATILEASLHSKKVWEAFMGRSDVSILHQTLLLEDPRNALREHIAQSIASVCGGDLPSTSPLTGAETATCFWGIISTILPEAIRYPNQSEQLFAIAEQVFRSHDEHSRNEEALRSSLMSWSSLLLHYDHEESVGREEVDFVVLGFTKLLLCCIPSLKSFKKPLNASDLMVDIFRKFLFIPRIDEVDDEVPPEPLPVLESNIRKELYDLMLALADDRKGYFTLLSLAGDELDPNEDMSIKPYMIDRSNEIRSCTGYVGLVNPRAICYMNSLLTQLYMNINFRKFMLGLNVADAGGSQRLLSETQRLFASMQNMFRKAADPRDFASCVKGLDGLPIDINIQMDADEFYNLLFDQWEGQMLSPEIKQQFRSFYGGQTVNQIKSKECEHVSERIESFFVVQCDVQGKANLQESLQAFVEGDVMEGDNKYKCESCGGKFVDAVKRTCLKDVPDNLIFHLKRFDFDLVDMRRAKINDHFEFPVQIDVSPYNVDHLGDPSKPRKEDIFELVGVLVHQGTSENGHYYSYIRERPCPSGSMTSWVEFNDRDVDTFDHQSIPYHAFGGFYDEQYPRQQKQFSAYMLFYQRKTAIEKDHGEYISSPHCGPPRVPIPRQLEQEISRDNEDFVREYCLFDPNHSRFVRQILTGLRTVNNGTCSEDHQYESQAIQLVLEHLFQIVVRQRDAENFDETMTQLRKTVLNCTICCQSALMWLASRKYALSGLFMRCFHMKVRSQMRAFIIDSLRFLREKDPALYGIENADTDMETGTVAPMEGILVDIVQRLRTVAREWGSNARGWDDFYLTLCQLSDMGFVETAVMLNKDILGFCLRILCMHAYPQFRLEYPDIWRLVEKKKGVFNRLTELVYTFFTRMDIRLPAVPLQMDRMESLDRTTSKFPLSVMERNIMWYWHDDNRAVAVLDKMIEMFDITKTEVFYPGEVLKWMLQSSDPTLMSYLQLTVSEGVSGLTPPYSDPYVRAAVSYCQASHNASAVQMIIDVVSKSTVEIRDVGGEVRLYFLNSLPTFENEAVFEEKGPDFFYDYALLRSRQYALPLLMYDDDYVRRATARHLDELFTKVRADHTASEYSLKLKYTSVRRLAQEINRRLVQEHDTGTSRTYMQPMIQVSHLLVQLLFDLTNSEDPIMDQYKHMNDAAIIQSYQLEVEQRLRMWIHDEGTPISTGGEKPFSTIFPKEKLTGCEPEAYEQSDYGSESDEGPDLET
ncbi:hypothetical protein CC78DRAFT_574360 [Lojkania enalia]|uniref:USP domain-containing protein n=1 Tax=Lojkania enalia TaxID=147567 RepID=A0A9P4TPU8_9PLEO|nr:hypothetical protein CC78DRAFT_574360 [Didymosphaeria enalia]